MKLIRYGMRIGGSIKNLISIVNYSTFCRWVNAFKAGELIPKKLGRPRTTPQEVINLILRMATENLDWGFGRIKGELNKLNLTRGRNTIKSIMREHGLDPAPKRYEDSWDAFIKRTYKTLYACDFFSREIWTPLGKKVIFVLFFINIRTREVHIAGITDSPNRTWMINKAKQMDEILENAKGRKLLIRDGDKKYPDGFDKIFEAHKTEVKVLPFRSPNLNPYAESWVSLIKRECLDKFFIFGESHFEYIIKTWLKYYNTLRPHSGLNNNVINNDGQFKCESSLGGVIKHYYRE